MLNDVVMLLMVFATLQFRLIEILFFYHFAHNIIQVLSFRLNHSIIMRMVERKHRGDMTCALTYTMVINCPMIFNYRVSTKWCVTDILCKYLFTTFDFFLSNICIIHYTTALLFEKSTLNPIPELGKIVIKITLKLTQSKRRNVWVNPKSELKKLKIKKWDVDFLCIICILNNTIFWD